MALGSCESGDCNCRSVSVGDQTISNLTAIVRATRASARAIKRMQQLTAQIRATDDIDIRADLFRQHDRALIRYHRAQAILRANPLPGDIEHV